VSKKVHIHIKTGIKSYHAYSRHLKRFNWTSRSAWYHETWLFPVNWKLYTLVLYKQKETNIAKLLLTFSVSYKSPYHSTFRCQNCKAIGSTATA